MPDMSKVRRPMACRSGSFKPRSACWPSRGRPRSRHARSHQQPGCRRWWSTATSVGSPSSPAPSSTRDSRSSTAAFSQLPVTDDPIADLAVQALTCRRVARENPHLYDLMFGLSTRAKLPAATRPAFRSRVDVRRPSGPPTLTSQKQCARLVNSGRVRQQDPDGIAAQLWSFVHGFITLELAETFVEFDDPVEAGAVANGSESFCRTGRYARACRGLTPNGCAPLRVDHSRVTKVARRGDVKAHAGFALVGSDATTAAV